MCEERWRGKREGRKRLPRANTPFQFLFVWVLLEQFKGNSALDVADQEWYRTWICAALLAYHSLHRKPEITAVSYQLHYPAANSILAKTKRELPSSLLGLSPISPS